MSVPAAPAPVPSASVKPTTMAPPPPDPMAVPLPVFGRGTLSRHLIVRVAVLVAIVAILLDAAGVVIARRVLINSLDNQLLVALQQGPVPSASVSGGAASWSTNSIQVVIQNGTITEAEVVQGRAGGSPLTFTEVTQLERATAETAPLGNVQVGHGTWSLPGGGDYRVIRGVQRVSGVTIEIILGLPMTQVDDSIQRLLVFEALITAGVVLLSAVAGAAVVRVTMRPLTRLAQTAATVARTPLDRGEVRLATRVSPADADPNNEIGRVGLALNTMLDNVEYALASRQRSETQVRQFVADASHELRNPLAAIRGYAELTRRNADQLPPDTAFALGRIDAESARMSKLVENLLLLARLDNGQRPDFAPVDAAEVLVNAVSDAQVVDHTHVWTLQLPDEPVMVWADPNQLHQVIANLLGNARKHTPEGTKVDAAAQQQGAYIVITVTDDGPGIAPDLLGHVFERFARADVARTHDDEGSTGLGLAIVAAVIAAHGGWVSAESAPGRTCFTIVLPTYVPPPVAAPAASAPAA